MRHQVDVSFLANFLRVSSQLLARRVNGINQGVRGGSSHEGRRNGDRVGGGGGEGGMGYNPGTNKYKDTPTLMSPSLVFNRFYRLEIRSVMLVFSTGFVKHCPMPI
jgi:hypothetical protein